MTGRERFKQIAMATFTTSFLTLAVMAAPLDSPRVGADKWAQSLTEGERAVFIQAKALKGLPSEYRGALSRNLATAVERSTFWMSVIGEFKAAHQLSPDQLAVLSRVESLLVEAIQPNADRKAVGSKLAAVRGDVSAVLGEDAVRQLFKAAAPTESTVGLPLLERIKYGWRVNRPQSFTAAMSYVLPSVYADSWTCNCSDDDMWCPSHQTCGMPAEGCNPYEPSLCPGAGCGEWGCYGCWLICYYPN